MLSENFVNYYIVGKKDRVTLFPESLHQKVLERIDQVKAIHERDIDNGFGMTSLSPALIQKHGNSVKQFLWQYLFISPCVRLVVASNY